MDCKKNFIFYFFISHSRHLERDELICSDFKFIKLLRICPHCICRYVIITNFNALHTYLKSKTNFNWKHFISMFPVCVYLYITRSEFLWCNILGITVSMFFRTNIIKMGTFDSSAFAFCSRLEHTLQSFFCFTLASHVPSKAIEDHERIKSIVADVEPRSSPCLLPFTNNLLISLPNLNGGLIAHFSTLPSFDAIYQNLFRIIPIPGKISYETVLTISATNSMPMYINLHNQRLLTIIIISSHTLPMTFIIVKVFQNFMQQQY